MIFRISFLPCLHVDCQFCALQWLYFLSPAGMPESQGKDSESCSSSSSNTGDSVASFGQVSSFCPWGKCKLHAHTPGNLLCMFIPFQLGYSKAGIVLHPTVLHIFSLQSLGIPWVIMSCSGFFSNSFYLLYLKVGLILFSLIPRWPESCLHIFSVQVQKSQLLSAIKKSFWNVVK